ncbi:MAG: MFS transporter [Bacteriovoracia bacterium]
MKRKLFSEFPKQIKYIVGTEACERFSFYGMNSILVIFMVKHLRFNEPDSEAIYHLFISGCYLLSLLGAYLSDQLMGRYKTILFLSLFYCLGHGALAVWDNRMGLYLGLVLISLGAGGVKPCVSSFVADQFTDKQSGLIQKVYDIFYFSINFGSVFSSLLIPVLLVKYGPSVAFAIPGILMGAAVFVFWLGRKDYRHVPPSREIKEKRNWKQTFKILWPIMKVFGAVSFFWSLWFQTHASWVLQAEKMQRNYFGVEIQSSQMPSLNPIFVMLLIPLTSLVIYPWLERRGFRMNALRRMVWGMYFAAAAFVTVTLIQLPLDQGVQISVFWQVIPSVIMALSEVMVSISGLEFAYTQAPQSMKSMVMSLWFLTLFFGNLFTAIISKFDWFEGSHYFLFFAILMLGVSVAFSWVANNFRKKQPAYA